MFDMDKVWDTPKEYNHLVKVLGFATGCIHSDASPEMLKAYEDVAKMCEFYLNHYNNKFKTP